MGVRKEGLHAAGRGFICCLITASIPSYWCSLWCVLYVYDLAVVLLCCTQSGVFFFYYYYYYYYFRVSLKKKVLSLQKAKRKVGTSFDWVLELRVCFYYFLIRFSVSSVILFIQSPDFKSYFLITIIAIFFFFNLQRGNMKRIFWRKIY